MSAVTDRARARRALRADIGVASTLALLAASLYFATLCRTVYWYDSAEYVTAAHTLGVPHPPGYPLYTLLAHAFLVLPLSPALAVNAMSAVFAALAVALCYASARILCAGRLAAAAGAALLGSGPSFWLNATVAEVYAPGLCFVLGVLLLLLQAEARKRPRLAVLAAAVAGAGMGVHYSLATLGLGFAWLALQPALLAPSSALRTRRVVGLLSACVLAVVLTYAVVFSYVVLRAESDVVPNQARPFSFARLAWLLAGGNYRLWFVHDFDVGARLRYVIGLVTSEVSFAGVIAALFGVFSLLTRARTRAVALLLSIAGNVFFFFRYRVDDLEVFLLPSVALLCVCAAVGAQAMGDRLAASRAGGRAVTLIPLFLLAFAAVRVWGGYQSRDLSAFTAANDYGERLAVQLPYRAVILNYTTPDEWKYDAVFGMYFQQVLGRRRDVMVVSNADRPVLDRLLYEGRPTYLYAPVDHVAREYVLATEGDLVRLLRRR